MKRKQIARWTPGLKKLPVISIRQLWVRVNLRPVNLLQLNKLIQERHGLEARRRNVQFARQLAFGQNQVTS